MPIVFAQFLKPNQPQSHFMKTPYKIKKKKRCASKIIKKEEVHVLFERAKLVFISVILACVNEIFVALTAYFCSILACLVVRKMLVFLARALLARTRPGREWDL